MTFQQDGEGLVDSNMRKSADGFWVLSVLRLVYVLWLPPATVYNHLVKQKCVNQGSAMDWTTFTVLILFKML